MIQPGQQRVIQTSGWHGFPIFYIEECVGKHQGMMLLIQWGQLFSTHEEAEKFLEQWKRRQT